MRRIAATLLALVLVAAACGDSAPTFEEGVDLTDPARVVDIAFYRGLTASTVLDTTTDDYALEQLGDLDYIFVWRGSPCQTHVALTVHPPVGATSRVDAVVKPTNPPRRDCQEDKVAREVMIELNSQAVRLALGRVTVQDTGDQG